MTQTAYPFDAGAGSAIVEGQWRAMARNWVPSGVMANELNVLKVVGDSTGMQVKASSGRAWVSGHFYENDAQVTLAIAAAHATNPRLDLVVLRADFTANTIVLAVVTGTAAASPVAPALTQSASTWEIALARVRVNAAVVTIAAGDVTDLRAIVGGAVLRREVLQPAHLNAAVGDGATDVSAAFNECLDKARLAGGGEVFAGHGTSMVKGLVLGSGVDFYGAGPGRTTLKAPAGANTDVIVGYNFGALAGSDSIDGIVQCAVRMMAIDGNKAANPTSGYGLRVYGFDYLLEHLRVRNCRQDGIFSEWSSYSPAPSTVAAMEAKLIDVKSHDNGGNGITWKGPHDSVWVDVIAYLNGARGFSIEGNGGALIATACQSWGLGQTYAWYIAALAKLIGCKGEGATTGQFLLAANDIQLIGCDAFAAGVMGTAGIIHGISGGAAPAAVCVVGTKLLNFDSAGALKFVNDPGLGLYDVLIYQLTGTAVQGTPNPATVLRTKVTGGATGSGSPAVTGSRGGNAALASLLTKLEGAGYIVDSTVA